MLSHRKNIALAALLSGVMALFVAPASAAVTFAFSGLAMATELNGEPEQPDAFVSGSVTVSELRNTPSYLNPPWLRVDSVNFTISRKGSVIRSFSDPSYFSYVSYTNIYGISEVEVGPGINITGLPLDSNLDMLNLDFYQGLVNVSLYTIEETAAKTYNTYYFTTIQDVRYVESAPEISTWAMIALGFASLGVVGWQSRRAAHSNLAP